MTTAPLQDARSAVVRDLVLDGVSTLLRAGEDLTFARVAKASGVSERTVYRHFPTREALLTAVFVWVNRQIGLSDRPRTGDEVVQLVRRVFPGFDELAPVILELLAAPEGLLARLSDNEDRRDAATAVVRHEAPDLDPASTRRVAAVLQLLSTAATWQSLRDYWGMDGEEAAEASALAIELLVGSLRDRPMATRAQRAAPAGRAGEDPLTPPLVRRTRDAGTTRPDTRRPPMQLLSGVNHVAVLTDDLDRFVEFYAGVFELEVVFEETTDAFRHAVLRTGPESWLHPAEVQGNPHGTGVPVMFGRGHLDHVALTAASGESFELLRRRLVEREATTGTVEDLGAFHSLWFTDPDGMQVELTVIVDPQLRGIHEPRAIAEAALRARA